jgi:predicted Zn-dependent peptidase
VREKAGITYQINSFVNSYYDASAFGIYFSTNENNLSKALKIINTEVRKLQDRRISKKELSRIKEYMKGTILLGMENTSNRMIRLANSILYFDRYIPVEEIITKIDEVTADDILYLAQNVLSDEGLTKIFIRSNSSSRRKGAIIN